jgi:tetratricopeptide (TPR) repeat protein
MRRPLLGERPVARPDSTQATETLHEIDSIFERLAHWVATHPVPVVAALALLLLSAAGVGGYRTFQASREAGASAEVAAIQAEYREAMGARPGDLEIPEPANAEAAAATRREYATRFAEAAGRRAGTHAAVSARLEAGTLLAELGDREGALAAWHAAAAAAPEGSALAALAQTRLAADLEAAGDARAAAEAYLAAGQVAEFPARVIALGDAARCFADAGDTARALEIFGALSEEDVAELPPYVASRLAELRARSQAQPPPTQ